MEGCRTEVVGGFGRFDAADQGLQSEFGVKRVARELKSVIMALWDLFLASGEVSKCLFYFGFMVMA